MSVVPFGILTGSLTSMVVTVSGIDLAKNDSKFRVNDRTEQ